MARGRFHQELRIRSDQARRVLHGMRGNFVAVGKTAILDMIGQRFAMSFLAVLHLSLLGRFIVHQSMINSKTAGQST